MSGIDYKDKYMSLRAKFLQGVDQAFQLGYEKGYNEGTQAEQMNQMAAQQEAAMQGQQFDEDGNPIHEHTYEMDTSRGGRDKHFETRYEYEWLAD